MNMTAQGKNIFTKIRGMSGFTLLELVMVIVLLGIIAFYAIPRLGTVASANAGVSVDKLRADIRYAQDLAMTRNQRVRVTIVSANAYRITDAMGNLLVDPATGGNYLVTFGPGISFGIVTLAGNYVEFDSLGVPYDSAGALNAAGTVTVMPGALTVTVTPVTGAVN